MSKIVWVNGCFDILHRGHIELLEYARSCGDYLVVGIDHDARVRSAKGDSRPFNVFGDRKYVLESLRSVDRVVGFENTQELEEHVKLLNPFCMIVGSDWQGKEIIGSQFAQQVCFFDRIGDYSTTKILRGLNE